MTHSYSLIGVAKNLTIHLMVLAVFFVSARNTLDASDRDTLEYVANKIDTNYGGIYSWQGSAVVQRTAYLADPPPDFYNEQYTKFEYGYAFDKSKGDYFSSSRLLDEYSVYDGVKKHILVTDKSYVSKDDVCYNLEWYRNRNVPVVSVKNNAFLPVNPSEITRIVHIHKKPFDLTKQPYRDSLFNPFEKYSSDMLRADPRNRTSAVMEIRAIVKGMDINKMSDLSESLLKLNSHPEDVATLVTKNNKITLTMRHTNLQSKDTAESNYVFDTEQGYNVIIHNYQIMKENNVIQKQQWQCSYTLVDGFWVPKKTEMNTELSGTTLKQIVEWTSHHINESIPESTFTLQNMGVCRGDTLYDGRTETTTIISGDDFPAPPHQVVKENIRFPIARYVLVVLGSIMVLVALFDVYRKRQANHKKGGK